MALADVPMFDLPDGATVADPMDGLSADGRRRVRQADAVRRGVHPLALVITGVLFHPLASLDATATDPKNLRFRCGSCVHRDATYRFPKCTFSQTRISRGPGTDVRAWWPACTDYQERA